MLNSHEQVYLCTDDFTCNNDKMCNMKHYHRLYISATFSYETFSLVSGYYWPFMPLINMETLQFRFQ